jgi:hypothetical protein
VAKVTELSALPMQIIDIGIASPPERVYPERRNMRRDRCRDVIGELTKGGSYRCEIDYSRPERPSVPLKTAALVLAIHRVVLFFGICINGGQPSGIADVLAEARHVPSRHPLRKE